MSQRRESFLLTSKRPEKTMLMDMDPLEESGTEPPTEAPTRVPSPKDPTMNDFFSNFSLGDPPKKANGNGPSPLSKQVASPGTMSPKAGAETPDGKDEKKEDKEADMDGSKGEEQKEEEKKPEEKKPEDGPPPAQSPKKKVGNLMKELRNDVQQGAMEFNIDNFF